MSLNQKTVLLVEDDSVDALTVKRAFSDLNITNPLVHVTNGEEALQYLNNPDNPRPCVILSDLNMPKMNGIELLAELKKDALLKKIPFIALTTSKDEQDVVGSFKNNVAGYMVKPVDYQKFVETVRAINLYWTLSELPDGE